MKTRGISESWQCDGAKNTEVRLSDRFQTRCQSSTMLPGFIYLLESLPKCSLWLHSDITGPLWEEPQSSSSASVMGFKSYFAIEVSIMTLISTKDGQRAH